MVRALGAITAGVCARYAATSPMAATLVTMGVLAAGGWFEAIEERLRV